MNKFLKPITWLFIVMVVVGFAKFFWQYLNLVWSWATLMSPVALWILLSVLCSFALLPCLTFGDWFAEHVTKPPEVMNESKYLESQFEQLRYNAYIIELIDLYLWQQQLRTQELPDIAFAALEDRFSAAVFAKLLTCRAKQKVSFTREEFTLIRHGLVANEYKI
jgi:hypothetical protein